MKNIISFALSFLIILLISCGGNTPEDQFVDAAGDGDISTLETLLSQGVDINCRNTGVFASEETACMKAAEKGELETLKFLVEKGADINIANSGGENPITYAAKNDHQDIVLYLIDQGADVNYQESNYGMTAILQASYYGDTEYIKKLLNKGADIDVRGKEGQTPLTMACSNQKADAANLLIKHGADPDMPGHYGWTPLMLAVQTLDKNLYDLPDDVKNTIDVLLAAGADINKQDGDGNTALIHAAMEKSHGVADYLISKGANVNITNNAGGDYLDAFNSEDY
jgi:ankyrin repeat protein